MQEKVLYKIYKKLTTHALTQREEGRKEERERIKKELTEQELVSMDDGAYISLGNALWVVDSKEDREKFLQALSTNTENK
jgi:hypothetical protein